MQIYDVKINGLENPIGFQLDTIQCSWKVKGLETDKGTKQKHARIEVSCEEHFGSTIYSKDGNLNSIAEPLELMTEPYRRYYFRIIVTTDCDEVLTSEVCYFETAKQEETWQGCWIGMQEENTFHPVFQKEFQVNKAVQSARLYITGLGLFEAYVNGQKAGTDLYAPFVTEYEDNLQYCTYDVTASLEASNTIQVLLGNGWYKSRYGFAPVDTARRFGCLAELRMTYFDGSVEVIGTDDSWKYTQNFIEFSGIYDGEGQNYLLVEDNPVWNKAQIVQNDYPLTARYSSPVHEMESLMAKEVIHTPAGETVLDFGQNFAGYVECSETLGKGSELTLEFGEILQNGNFYHENYRTAESTFHYVSDGRSRVIRPHFTFFGFRYVKVTADVEIHPENFVGKAVYSQMEQTGYLQTGNNKINQLISNSMWGLKSNFLDIPTDCPQRDERLGWTGDAQVFCQTAGYHMDTRAFYQKFLRDLRINQRKRDGRMPIYCPSLTMEQTSSVWSDIATFLPRMLYEYYGDKSILASNYPMMKEWVDWVTREDEKRGTNHLWNFGFHFGDWLALDGATDQSMLGRTDSHYVASVYYYASTSYVADAAKVLDNGEAEKYRKLAGQIKDAILHEFFTPSGRLAIDTQTGYLLALKFGVYRDKKKVILGLKNRMKKDCYRMKSGFVGATMMNQVLAENGLERLAYDMLFFEGFPGWLYQVNLGATTIWERWNSVLADGKISGTGMNSLNHYSYGSVVEFLYRQSAGLVPLEPGFRKVRFEPKPDIRLGSVECSYDSASGKYVANWKLEADGKLNLHFEVPFGAEAVICLPESGEEEITVNAGCYDFSYMPKKDYRKIFDGDTRMEYLLQNAQARAILQKYMPDVVQQANGEDVESMAKCIHDMEIQASLFGAPEHCYQALIDEIAQCVWNKTDIILVRTDGGEEI